MKKLLVVCGPTAVGKTPMAMKLAKKFDGELVSADSRQVYKGLDIGTGKDLPADAKFKFQNAKMGGYYLVGDTKIWGYDLVDPKEEFSVSDYIRVARELINDIWSRNKLPILVGGTGFYIKGVLDGVNTVGVRKDDELRKELQGKSIGKLIVILGDLDPLKASRLNESDRKNPRRLIRAIEVAKNDDYVNRPVEKLLCNSLFIGLSASKGKLDDSISVRVGERIKKGALREIKDLLSKGVSWDDQSMTGVGYRQMREYFGGTKKLKECIDGWKLAEAQYAKRQMTWFRKEKRINWFDAGEDEYLDTIENFVARWYFNSKDVSQKN